MCSKQFQISHYPKGYKQERIPGMGLNEEELKRNPVNYINNPMDKILLNNPVDNIMYRSLSYFGLRRF